MMMMMMTMMMMTTTMRSVVNNVCWVRRSCDSDGGVLGSHQLSLHALQYHYDPDQHADDRPYHPDRLELQFDFLLLDCFCPGDVQVLYCSGSSITFRIQGLTEQ